jgi:hypothetical protein
MALEKLSRTVDLSRNKNEMIATTQLCNRTLAECGTLSRKQIAIFTFNNHQNTNMKYLGTSAKIQTDDFLFVPLTQDSLLDSEGDNQVAFRFHQDAIDSCTISNLIFR